MYHPSKWGENWYLDINCIPFYLKDGVFIEQPPINVPKNFKPKFYKFKDVVINEK